MLDRSHRLTSGRLFAHTIRRGRRAGTSTLLVHLARGVGPETSSAPQVGFVVSKAVGNAVTRNRVKRRLRHLVRERLPRLPVGSLLVVRALPPAAAATSRTLGGDLDRALDRVLARGTR